MLGSFRGLAIAAVLTLGAVGMSHGGASALTLPVQQNGAAVAASAQSGNVHQVVEHRRRVYWRNRQARFGYARQGYNPRTWRRPNRYWRHRYNRFDRWPRYNYWPYRPGFYYGYGGYWDDDPWYYDDPPVIVAPRVSYRRSAHVEWCLNRYRSYNPRTNTWVGYSGRVYQCNSPYDRR